jgi:hypothetical protein
MNPFSEHFSGSKEGQGISQFVSSYTEIAIDRHLYPGWQVISRASGQKFRMLFKRFLNAASMNKQRTPQVGPDAPPKLDHLWLSCLRWIFKSVNLSFRQETVPQQTAFFRALNELSNRVLSG